MDYDDNSYLISNAQDDDDEDHNTSDISMDTASTKFPSWHGRRLHHTSCRSKYK